jgi:predicted alpha-1,6-mannanase (GH76 family)
MVAPKIYLGLTAGIVMLHVVHHPKPVQTRPQGMQVAATTATSITRPNLDAGMTALQQFYDAETGLWTSAKWWNSANALTTTIDYSQITATDTYRETIANTFAKHQDSQFLSPWFYDDEGWWALTWINAYDLTGDRRYLDMAKTIFADMTQGWDDTCGGGLWWTKDHTYKNAITNELFMLVAARLQHTAADGDRTYLDWAQKTWTWLKQSHLINANQLINDGLTSDCQNNGQTTWTYNQGVILGGLVELYQSTQDPALLTQAEAIADAAIRTLAPNGILQEPCEPSDCGVDGLQFKGIFIRYLAHLYQATHNPAYKAFVLKNADSIWSNNRNPNNQFGLMWQGPLDSADAVRQSSAMDALNAAVAIGSQDAAETTAVNPSPVNPVQ